MACASGALLSFPWANHLTCRLGAALTFRLTADAVALRRAAPLASIPTGTRTLPLSADGLVAGTADAAAIAAATAHATAAYAAVQARQRRMPAR